MTGFCSEIESLLFALNDRSLKVKHLDRTIKKRTQMKKQIVIL